MADLTWYDSSETGMPIMNNVAGSFIAVLDACLIDGFNTKTISSIVVASGVATVNCTAHGYTATVQKPVEISGSSESALNGKKQVLTVAADTFTYAAPGVPDGTYTGTLSAKRPGLGWIKAFSGTNKAIYQRTDVAATTNMLRVDNNFVSPADTISNYVFMVESATDIDSYTSKAPSSDSYCLWSNGPNTSTAKTWAIIGDGKRIFVMVPNGSTTYSGHHLYFFGDPDLFKPSDSYGCLISCHAGTNMSTTESAMFSYYNTTTSTSTPSTLSLAGLVFAGNYTGTAKPFAAAIKGLTVSFSSAYPSSVSEPNILLGPSYLTDTTGVRGKLNVYYASVYQPHSTFTVVQPDNEPYYFFTFRANGGPTSEGNSPCVYIRLEGWS